MRTRIVLVTALALLAAVMLVASVVGIPTGWWSGAPIKNGVASLTNCDSGNR